MFYHFNMRFTWVWFFVPLTSSFNLEPKSSIVLHGSADNNSSFGYSLAFTKYHPKLKSEIRLLVGAPNGYYSAMSSGTLFECIVDARTCYDSTESFIEKYKNYNNLRWNNNARFGATITENPNGLVAACAPNLGMYNENYMPGKCFIRNNTQYPSTILFGSTKFRGMIQSGFSAHFVQNIRSDNHQELMVGGPEYNRGSGRVDLYFSSGGVFESVTEIVDMNPSKYAYFGYALVAGKFHRDRNKITYIVSSMKFQRTKHDSVHVYISKYPITLHGLQFGEMFGYSLLVIDLNNDKMDDILIVGAPMYHGLEGHDHGRIYTFKHQTTDGFVGCKDELITGSSSTGARFGTSLAVIGDLNCDGFNDIAVGAPYEENGAVYIYHGNKNGIDNFYSQRITPADINYGKNRLLGFGFSLAGGVDIDGNSVNDIAVGSFLSSNAVVMKAYPVVNIEGTLSTSVASLNTSSASTFTIKFCLKYISNVYIRKTVEVKVTFEVDKHLKRAVKLGFKCQMANDVVELRQSEIPFCCGIDLKQNENVTQFAKPLEILMHFVLKNDTWEKEKQKLLNTRHDKSLIEEERFFHAVTDPRKPSWTILNIPFDHGCNKTDVCVADLKVQALIIFSGSQLVMGLTKNLTLIASVTNKGDPAYSIELLITLPQEQMYIRMPPNCRDSLQQVNLVICKISEPLYSKNPKDNSIQEEKVVLDLDLSRLTVYQTHLKFNLTVTSPNEDIKSVEDNTFLLNQEVKFISNLQIEGLKKGLTKRVNEDAETNSTNILKFIHTYEVYNTGPSPVASVSAMFQLPVYVFSNGVKVKLVRSLNVQVNKDSQYYLCEINEQFEKFNEFSNLPDNKEEQANIETQSRTKRMATNISEVTTTENEEEMNASINCLNNQISCAKATCNLGGIKPDSSRIKISIHYIVSQTILNKIMAMNDNNSSRISIASYGTVVNHNESLYLNSSKSVFEASTYTVFVGDLPASKLSYWQIVLAGVAGALLLTGVIAMLSKAGFFKRADKEKLDNLKKANAEDDFQPDATAPSDDVQQSEINE